MVLVQLHLFPHFDEFFSLGEIIKQVLNLWPTKSFSILSHCAKAPEALLDGGLGKNLAFAYQAAFLVHGHLILLKCFAVSFEKQDFP